MDKAHESAESERFEKVLETISEFFAMDNPSSSFNRVLRDLMECCPEGVIVGGMAVSFYVKNPRTTKDVDIILLDKALDSSQFRQRFETVAGKPLTVQHKETGIEVDLLLEENPVLNRELLRATQARFRMIERAGITVRVAAPEMIIALKLRRAMNNTALGLQDRTDIVSLLNDNAGLDLSPIRELVAEEEGDLLDDLLTYRENLLTETHD